MCCVVLYIVRLQTKFYTCHYICITINSEMLRIVDEQQRQEHAASNAKAQIAYLRDVHLALLLSRLELHILTTLFAPLLYIAEDTGKVNVILRGSHLGDGWIGRMKLVSTIARHQLDISAPAELCNTDSLFRYQLPTMFDEWAAEFFLEYRPSYTVPNYICIPVTAHTADFHIDTLDAIVPCYASGNEKQQQSEETDICSLDQANSTLCLCEIWLSPIRSKKDTTSGYIDGNVDYSNTELVKLASRLLPTLLFENMPLKAADRVSGIMISNNTAEFAIAGTSNTPNTTTLVCIPESNHIAIRIRSTDQQVYAAVLHAFIKRLMLLLSYHNTDNPDSNVSSAEIRDNSTTHSLVNLQTKYALVIANLLQNKHNKSSDSVKPFEYIDFANVGYASIIFPS
ncbi:hypothetical protein BX070DRAFT_43526 [Coemansia spiralis]|nr:hypothetical protein BX070DRAFT_43526 [Coemansia spiralis]